MSHKREYRHYYKGGGIPRTLIYVVGGIPGGQKDIFYPRGSPEERERSLPKFTGTTEEPAGTK